MKKKIRDWCLLTSKADSCRLLLRLFLSFPSLYDHLSPEPANPSLVHDSTTLPLSLIGFIPQNISSSHATFRYLGLCQFRETISSEFFFYEDSEYFNILKLNKSSDYLFSEERGNE